MTVVATALLAGAAWTLGRLSIMACDWPELRRYERLGLEMTAGFGLNALSLSLLALSDPMLFLAACRRKRITHLLASPWAFGETLTPFLRVAYDSPHALKDGEHVFRAPGTEHVTLFQILP